MVRLCSSIGGLLFACMLLGCSGDHSTNGAKNQTIPTLNLSDQIVLHVSESFDSVAYIDSTNHEYGLQMPVELLTKSNGITDIQLQWNGPEQCHPAHVHIYDYTDSTWIEIVNQRNAFACYGVVGQYRLSLLPFLGQPGQSLVSPSGLIRLKGDLDHPSGQVIEVHADYQPLIVSLRALSEKVIWLGDRALVWIKQRGEPKWIVDSLIWIDMSGNRLRGLELTIDGSYGDGIDGIAWSGSEIWVSAGMVGGRGYLVLDDLGQPVGEFIHSPAPSNQRVDASEPIAWVDGEIWVKEGRYDRPPGPGEVPLLSPYITVIDPAASLDSGFSVVLRSFPLDESLQGMGGITFDGQNACTPTLHGIVRMDMNGAIIDTLPLPVRVASIAWDGEAFLITHKGPWEVPTDYFLLSRFWPR